MSEDVEKEKIIKKDIKFFDIIYSNSFYIEDNQNPIVQVFTSTFDSDLNLYEYGFKKAKYKFEIEECNKNYLFGWFIKVDNSLTNPASQSQLRNKKTGEISPVTFSDDSDLERYTFFMCDFDNRKMASIVTRSTNKLAEVLSDYLHSKSSVPISIVPIKHSDIKKKAGQLKLINKIVFSKEPIDEFQTLGEIELKNVQSYEIKMTIKETEKGMFNGVDLPSYRKYKILGITEEDEEVIIDLLEKTLSKTKNIEYSYSDGPNVSEIKEVLRKELQELEKDI